MSASWRIRYSAASLLLPARRTWARSIGVPGPGAFRILTLHHARRQQFEVIENLVDYILANHRFLTPREAEDFATGNAVATRDRQSMPYLLTFDDGFESNFEVAQSILAPRAIQAVFFVLPGLIDAPPAKQQQMTAEFVFDGLADSRFETNAPLMGWDQIKELRKQGHAIGSHSCSHRRLSSLPDDEVNGEIAGSATLLADKLNERIDWFAYPFGTVESMSRVAFAVVQRTYRFCCSAVRGINKGASPLALFRENIELEAPPHYQQFVCEGGLDFYYRNKRRQLLAMLR